MSERERERLEAWLERGKLDWAVWFIDPVLIAEYDSAFTVFERSSGEIRYHGTDWRMAQVAAQEIIARWGDEGGEVPVAGETYEARY